MREALGQSKQGCLILNCNIHKAFDTLSWDAISSILQALGFPATLTSIVKGCVLMGSSRVVINRVASKNIFLRRGVRQGDPLSSYLFIIAIDFLARWTAVLSDQGMLQHPFSHIQPCLLYVDDTVFFFKLSVNQATLLRLISFTFHGVTGLNLNPDKSNLLTIATSQHQIDEVREDLSCKLTTFPITLLGLQQSDKKLTKTTYLPLIHKIES